MCQITQLFKEVLAVTQVICGRYHGAFDLNVITVHMGLNFDEPQPGGMQTCGAERACQKTPHHEGPP